MKKILATALVGILTSSAQAIELKLIAGDDRGADKHITLALSETGLVSIYMTMFERDGNVSFINGFLDATPLGSEDAVGYDVLGNIFKMERNDGTRWLRNSGRSDSRNIEDYMLLARDARYGDGIGTDAPWAGVVDSIIIHGTEIGEYDLYFENRETAEGEYSRWPTLFDRDLNQKPYAANVRIPGFIWFKNAWLETFKGYEFDVPFLVHIVPEPSSLALLAVGVVALRRTKGNRGTRLRKED